ncbi:MAG: HAD family phosphatase [Dethiobacter sp.]|nr:MAG: HAD family phosphatase [Dethiobacter sp.]
MLKKAGNQGKIIFDMDGVITGEECYWNTASLVVWELLYSKRYLGLEPEAGLPEFKAAVTPGEIASIRKVVFQEDKVIAFIKKRAVNSNWDLAFLIFGYQLMLLWRVLSGKGLENTAWVKGKKGFDREHLRTLSSLLSSSDTPWRPSFEAILGNWTGEARGAELMQKLSAQLPGRYRELAETVFNSFSPLWKLAQDIFQEWYFGEEKYRAIYHREPAAPGKRGLIYDEKPLLPVEKIKDTLGQLLKKGWTLGIATGRPLNELHSPLKSMGIWELFDPGSIVTFDDVQKAEQSLKAEHQKFSLGKPHPFSFLKAYWGERFKERELVLSTFSRPQPGKCWIVGDSLADLMAAREMGAFFIGVLSGHSGADSKSLFDKEGARFVLPDITYIPHYIAEINGPASKQ